MEERMNQSHHPRVIKLGTASHFADNGVSSKYIAAGDLVIIFMSRDRTPMPLTVTPGAELVNSYGSFAHSSMIGLPFGSKMASKNQKGSIFLLRPSPEMWTLALPHRTQILYAPDMSFIAAHLGLSPGARIIEAGTGSGSFTHFLARTVGRKHRQTGGWGWHGWSETAINETRGGEGAQHQSRMESWQEKAPDVRASIDVDAQHQETNNFSKDSDQEQEAVEAYDEEQNALLDHLKTDPCPVVGSKDGRVWTFEFHAGRALKAHHELQSHGLLAKDNSLDYSNKITGVVSLRHRNVVKDGFGLDDAADAVFLDVPAPWEALQHAARAMRRDIPGRICCFSPCIEQVIRTVQVLRNPSPLSAVDKELPPSCGELNSEEIRWGDIETFECLIRTHISVKAGLGQACEMRSIGDAIDRIKEVERKKARRREGQIERARRERLRRLAAEDGDSVEADIKAGHEKVLLTKRPWEKVVKADDYESESSHDAHNEKLRRTQPVYSKPFGEMRGHTSYLTFATLLPRVVKQEPDPTLVRERDIERRKEEKAASKSKRKVGEFDSF